jgi:hypothetical protein
VNLGGIHIPTVVAAILVFVVLFFVLHAVAHR